MTLGKTILIAVLILVAVWFFMPDDFKKGRNWAEDQLGINLDDSDDSPSSNPATNNTVSNSTTNTTNTTETIVDEDEDSDDPCDLPNYGLPDYIGTEKEGDDCADTPTNQDFECIANPPLNYDGWINALQTTSSPALKCCLEDGYCRWD